MTFQEVQARSTIELFRSITLGESKILLAYLAKAIPANIHYHAEQYGSLRNEDERIIGEQGTSKLTATIMREEGPVGSDTVEFTPSFEDTSRFGRMQFVMIPGYDSLSDYAAERIELWDKTREAVELFQEIVEQEDSPYGVKERLEMATHPRPLKEPQ